MSSSHKTIGILQPGYLPWVGFFDQMARVDLFVYLDDVQFTKADWRTRNRILARNGPVWLSVPVKKAPVNTRIKDIEISYSQKWVQKHLNLIRENYKKAPYFEPLFSELSKTIKEKPARLIDLDATLVNVLKGFLNIDTPILNSSELNAAGNKTDKLINLCKATGATRLYDGYSARDFIEPEKFRCSGIELHYQKYSPVPYTQMFGEFVPYLSVVDLCFNKGPESLSIILGGADILKEVHF